jgi:hypothetical protein
VWACQIHARSKLDTSGRDRDTRGFATTTTHDDNATTWRDLADQLTPEQIAGLEGCERRFNREGVADDPRASGPSPAPMVARRTVFAEPGLSFALEGFRLL